MPITIATWNVNSVRLRMPLIEKLVAENKIDVLCLQETKVADEKFPHGPLEALGFMHRAIYGQKGYHGVATLSRLPLDEIHSKVFTPEDGARHIGVTVAGIEVHNFYVPAGGDEADTSKNPKFAHKLNYLTEMAAWGNGAIVKKPRVIVGDLNIAPLPEDVWSHKKLLKVVSHTPIEVEHLDQVQTAGSYVDVVRASKPTPEVLYSWWSYRSRDWQASNRGRRLDHIWTSPELAGAVSEVEILTHVRGWERPSDHVPILARFDL